MSDVERLLRSALVPIEPPERLSDRLERGLSELTEAAAEQLADWELSSMRDPRNWARPVGAVVVGTLAGGALVVVRARQQQRKRNQRPLQAIERGLRDVAEHLEKRLRR
jgi:predicted nucleic acid-binding protein